MIVIKDLDRFANIIFFSLFCGEMGEVFETYGI